MKYEAKQEAPKKIDLSELSHKELVSLVSALLHVKVKLEEQGYKLTINRYVSEDERLFM